MSSSKSLNRHPKADVPKTHHLDSIADQIAAEAAGDPNTLFTTKECAELIRMSTQWLDIGRSRGYGPKFIKLGPKAVRYRRRDVLKYLDDRTFARTSQLLRKAGK